MMQQLFWLQFRLLEVCMQRATSCMHAALGGFLDGHNPDEHSCDGACRHITRACGRSAQRRLRPAAHNRLFCAPGRPPAAAALPAAPRGAYHS